MSNGVVTLSGVYSPYSVHLIKSEVAGTIEKINAKEGQILKKGIPIVNLDSRALKDQKKQLIKILAEFRQAEKILLKNKELSKRKYKRYLRLKKKGHIEEQSVENVEKELHSAELSLIDNKRLQSEIKRNIIDLDDRIRKSAPAFPLDLYVAQNFKELFESVVPGESISRLLDISRAKIHIVLSPDCFLKIEHWLKGKQSIPFEIITEDGQHFTCTGKIEKLKLDPDNNYLYSYGFDLVFMPLHEILWGQVVNVQLRIGERLRTKGER